MSYRRFLRCIRAHQQNVDKYSLDTHPLLLCAGYPELWICLTTQNRMRRVKAEPWQTRSHLQGWETSEWDVPFTAAWNESLSAMQKIHMNSVMWDSLHRPGQSAFKHVKGFLFTVGMHDIFANISASADNMFTFNVILSPQKVNCIYIYIL